MQKKLDIVIPVFNEEKISSLFSLLDKNVSTSFKVLLCFDSYEDRTLKFYDPNEFSFEIEPILNEGKGVHSAIISGFK